MLRLLSIWAFPVAAAAHLSGTKIAEISPALKVFRAAHTFSYLRPDRRTTLMTLALQTKQTEGKWIYGLTNFEPKREKVDKHGPC